MNTGDACHASRTGHLVRDSFLYGWGQRNPPPRPLLAESFAGQCFSRAGRFHAVIAMAILACLVALFQGLPGVGFGAVAFLAALAFPVSACAVLPALFIWGPRLALGEGGGEALFLRVDQFVVAGLLLRGLLHPTERLSSPPASGVFAAFLAAIALSVLAGLVRGTLAAPVSALLYLAQWLELFGLYFVAWTFGARLRPIETYAWALPLIALAAYGLAEARWPCSEDPGVRYRTFERLLFPGQANHAAGLFALAAATGLGMALSPRSRALGAALVVLSTLAIFPTGSRSGALTWAAGIGVFALIRFPALCWWILPLGALGLIAAPARFWASHSAPGSSMHDRLVAWKSALSTVEMYPILGLGAGARHRSYYDNHYLMTLAESGLVGLALLLLLLVCLARALGHASARRGGWPAAGALAGLAALAIHGLATATFVVTMTAGPLFWYLGLALHPREEDS